MSMMMARRRQAVEKKGDKPLWYVKRMEAQALREKSRQEQLKGMVEDSKKRMLRMEAEAEKLEESKEAARMDIRKNLDTERNKKPMTPEEQSKMKDMQKEKRDAELKVSRDRLTKAAALNAKDSKTKAKPESKKEVKDGPELKGAAKDS